MIDTDRAIGIIRVSQRDDDTGQSPEVQARSILAQGAAAGAAVSPADLWDENDFGNGRIRPVSAGAALAERPKFLAAIEEVEAGRARFIIAERLDRLFRDLDIQRAVINRVEDAGGRILTANGSVSHATAESEAAANMMGVLNQYTKRTAKERSRAAVQLVIEQGRVPWPSTTIGYDRTADSRLLPNDQASIVRELFERRLAGPNGNPTPIEDLRVWLRAEYGIDVIYATVNSLLKSRVVLGEIHFGDYAPNLHAHAAIVPRDLWDDVQALVMPRGRQAKSERLLARLGVLRCGSCEQRMSVNHVTKGGKRYPLYRCQSRECPASQHISAGAAEQAVWEKTLEYVADAEGRAALEDETRRAELEADVAEATVKRAFKLALAAGLDNDAETEVELGQLRTAAESKRARADQLGGASRHKRVTVADCHRMTLAERRALIRNTIEVAVVSPGRGEDRIAVKVFGE